MKNRNESLPVTWSSNPLYGRSRNSCATEAIS